MDDRRERGMGLVYGGGQVVEPETETREPEVRRRRSGERKIDRMVQMSVRMMEDEYDAFREVCEKERRTNGEMLAIMRRFYARWHKELANKE